MSASTGTPTTRKSLARAPSMGGPSIASCFGASVPVSPRRTGGRGLLGGEAFGNYKQLINGCDEDEDEDEDDGAHSTHIPTAQAERTLNVSHSRQRSFSHFAGRQRPVREKGNKRDEHYASEGEGKYSRERTPSMKLGSHWILREKPRMSFCSNGAEAQREELYESEQGCDEYTRERRGVRKLGKLWSMSWETGNISSPTKTAEKEMYHEWGCHGDADVYVKEGNGGRKLGKLWRMSEKARKGVYYAVKPKREEHDPAAEDQGMYEGGTRERSGMSQVGIQLGKQGSMREKEGLDAGSPRRETLCRKVREACMQVLESARRSSPHVSELFVGNQLLMHVTSSSSSSLSTRRVRNVAPSVGFLSTGETTLCASMSPASTSTS